MNFDRIMQLAGLAETDYSQVTPFQTKKAGPSEKEKAAIKSNNDDVKNPTIDDISTEKVEVETIKQNKGKLFKVSSTQPKKFDYKIEIDSNGLAKVSNNTVVETVKPDEWIKDPDYHSKMYTIKVNDDYVIEATDSFVVLGDSQSAILFKNLELAEDFACIVDGEIYESVLVDPIHQIAESLFVDEYKELSEAEFIPTNNRPDNLEQDIISRLQQHQRVIVSVNYRGQMFVGDVISISPKGISVTPNAETIKRYNIINPKQVLLPVDFKALKWSDKYNNVITGHAKDVGSNLAPTAPNFAQKPEIGNPNDPSTFRVDYSSYKGPEGDQLSESIKPKKLIEYIAANMNNDKKEIQSKIAGLKKELKAAIADGDDELADDIRSDIQDAERQLAKCVSSSAGC